MKLYFLVILGFFFLISNVLGQDDEVVELKLGEELKNQKIKDKIKHYKLVIDETNFVKDADLVFEVIVDSSDFFDPDIYLFEVTDIKAIF